MSMVVMLEEEEEATMMMSKGWERKGRRERRASE